MRPSTKIESAQDRYDEALFWQAHGLYAEAEASCLNALDILEAQKASEQAPLATILSTLATICTIQERWSEAAQYSAKALAVIERFGGMVEEREATQIRLRALTLIGGAAVPESELRLQLV